MKYDHLLMEARADSRSEGWMIALAIVTIILVGCGFGAGMVMLADRSAAPAAPDTRLEGRFAKERALCDRAVDALLHSSDLVEVTRAGIIVRELDCGIGKRL